MAINYRPLAYTAPSGDRIEFIYDGGIEDEVSHNLGEFQFAGKDNKYYQDRSISTGAYAFTLLFDDQENLREARRIFSEKITADNAGSLEHPDPTLGTFPAVCSGFSVSQNSVKGLGIIRVSVQFFRQIPNLIGGDPAESNNPASAAATQTAIDALNTDQANDFVDSVALTTGNGVAAITETTNSVVQNIKNSLGFIAAKNSEINILFTNLAAEIISEADTLAREPFTLARQIQNLCQLPMLAIDSVNDRIAAYKELIEDSFIFSETQMNDITAGTTSGKNIIAVTGIATLAAISAINYSAVSGDSFSIDQVLSGDAEVAAGYLSRSEIVDTISAVQESARSTSETLSGLAVEFGATVFFDQYFDYSILNKNLVASTTRNLNARIFDAAQELMFITEKQENIIPLCGRIYNSVENSAVQFLLDSNNLHGDNIYLIPAGTEIIYYS